MRAATTATSFRKLEITGNYLLRQACGPFHPRKYPYKLLYPTISSLPETSANLAAIFCFWNGQKLEIILLPDILNFKGQPSGLALL